MRITENAETELVPIDQNPIAIGQFYKYMSFFFQVYLTLKSFTICMCLCPTCKALCAGATPAPPGGRRYGFSFSLMTQPPLNSRFSSHPTGPGVFVFRKTYVFRHYKDMCEYHRGIRVTVFTRGWKLLLFVNMFKDDRAKSPANKCIKAVDAE